MLALMMIPSSLMQQQQQQQQQILHAFRKAVEKQAVSAGQSHAQRHSVQRQVAHPSQLLSQLAVLPMHAAWSSTGMMC